MDLCRLKTYGLYLKCLVCLLVVTLTSSPFPPPVFISVTGAAGWGARQWAPVCCESVEEGCSLPGWGHRERPGGEEGPGALLSPSLPHIALLRLPDWGVCTVHLCVCRRYTMSQMNHIPFIKIVHKPAWHFGCLPWVISVQVGWGFWLINEIISLLSLTRSLVLEEAFWQIAF